MSTTLHIHWPNSIDTLGGYEFIGSNGQTID